jgi:malonyl-CoA/methylmalonyl-CoA synthetase
MPESLLALATAPQERLAASFPDGTLTYGQLRIAAHELAARLTGLDRVAIWATPRRDTCVAACAAVLARVALVPLNPKAGELELKHVLDDSDPDIVLVPDDERVPEAVRARGHKFERRGREPTRDASGDETALIIYTSGTTGPPKGVLMPREALASNLDALAQVWSWTADDVIVQALPLFHGFGLVVGMLGPLRRGGSVIHLGRFTPEGVADAMRGPGTILLAVPTMYHRLADAAQASPKVARGLACARLLTCGAGALPVTEHERILRLTGLRVLERYGMTETLMTTAVRPGGEYRPGFAGPPLPGVILRLVDDHGESLDAYDGETIGEIEVRGPNLFLGYLGREEETRAAYHDGWFRTGDLATRAPDGSLRIVGRRGTDLIKSGGYKIGAGEIESVLLQHPAVREAAVTAEPDPDLGERVVAWVVLRDESGATREELTKHVASELSPHKRPRRIVFLDALPRNSMGKVRKQALGAEAGRP